MLSNASKYAIRAVLFLAENSSVNRKFGSKQIAESLDVPQYFIAKILQKLVKAKIVTSEKGPSGGFYTGNTNLKKNVLDILSVIEKNDIFSECFLGLPVCGDENPCPVHDIVSKFKEALLEKFENQDIKSLSEEIKRDGTLITLKNII